MATFYRGGSTYATTTASDWYTDSTSSTAVTTYDGTGSDSALVWYDGHGNRIYGTPPRTLIREVAKSEGVIKEPTGHLEIYLKDGTHIVIDREQNLRIRDENSKVIYKSNRVREFNRFINASDLLEEFIKEMGELGARQGDVLDTPINVFIHWLIYRAAKQDGDMVDPPKLTFVPQCKFCGRFISKTLAAKGFEFCSPDHAQRLYDKVMRHESKRRLGAGAGLPRLAAQAL